MSATIHPIHEGIIHAAEVQANFNTEVIERRLTAMGEIRDDKDFPINFAIQHALRRTLPYGKWTCKDGREVIFNREYQPILQRVNGVTSYADRNEWVENIQYAQMYYDDASAPMQCAMDLKNLQSTKEDRKTRKKSLMICLTVLKEFTPKESSSVQRVWSVLATDI